MLLTANISYVIVGKRLVDRLGRNQLSLGFREGRGRGRKTGPDREADIPEASYLML